MAGTTVASQELIVPRISPLTESEREEMAALGVLTPAGAIARSPALPESPGIERHAMHAPAVLNEAYHYAKAVAFSRGIRFDLGDKALLLISGTASVDEAGETPADSPY